MKTSAWTDEERAEMAERRERDAIDAGAYERPYVRGGVQYRAAIQCPKCQSENPLEEKCCTHGCSPGVTCYRCGAVRTADDPTWSCGGSVPDNERTP